VIAPVLMLGTLSIIHAGPAHATPNDPRYGQQWGPRQMEVERAWTKSTGKGITIAVLDTGVDLQHPDLKAKLLTGHDYVDGDDVPQDPEGHGTHVAGTAAAITGNGEGVVGVAPEAAILPLRVLSPQGGNPANVAQAIRDAADQGAEVINLSLGDGYAKFLGILNYDTLESALDYAYSKGSLCIVAAGNGSEVGEDNPSGYSHGVNAVIVTAHDVNRKHAGFAQRADTKWSVSAPGVDILSTWPGGGYQAIQGTSMATPHVAGLAALLFAQGLSNKAVAERIVSTAQPVGNSVQEGSGQVNAAAAVGLKPTPLSATTTTAPDVSGNQITGGPTGGGSAGSAGYTIPGSGPAAATTSTIDPLAGTGRGDDFLSDFAATKIRDDISRASRIRDIGDYRKQTYGFLAGTMIAFVAGFGIWQRRQTALVRR
jgi:thermitase